ncbi:MAG TPA: bifunctional 4-hydroxy-2-oxoglutarate aldolase/2-dehydro-3-deoxy-phosphogluconate aldolase [Gaiellaceae bacterium]|nr:bifunctional 4-hydroxy-2-oxoglutarate aldolase/2-dehydro-3-deoxy-phosphogluconate aldolase [Gaiellaceae bacterium]
MTAAAARAETVAAIAELRIVGIVRMPSAPEAVERGELLVAAGLTIVEVALTTPSGIEAIAALAAVRDGRIVGAGTVLDAPTAREAVAAGARFLVSPGLDEDVVREAARLGVASMPGAATATEVMRARSAGADFVKLFPASTYGVGHLRALRAVFPDVAFVPTGGVDATSARAWLDAGACALAVGSALSRGQAREAEREARALLAAAAYERPRESRAGSAPPVNRPARARRAPRGRRPA